MNLQIIKGNFNRGRMNIGEIKWLIDSYERLQEENGAMAEKHAEKDIAIAEFMRIIDQMSERIKELETSLDSAGEFIIRKPPYFDADDQY